MRLTPLPSRIIVENDHGRWYADPAVIDLMIEKHLPASVADLRAKFVTISGTASDYSDVHSVTEFLVMLADAASDT